jgi:hypothetical protein
MPRGTGVPPVGLVKISRAVGMISADRAVSVDKLRCRPEGWRSAWPGFAPSNFVLIPPLVPCTVLLLKTHQLRGAQIGGEGGIRTLQRLEAKSLNSRGLS